MTIIRPSIIESALAEPRPGWIRGFRMAEPIIVSYARGLLREFPGVPEGVTDVIPVDLVVAAIIAVAAEAVVSPVEEYRTDRVPRRLRGAEPLPVRTPGRPGPGMVHRASSLRRRRPTHRRARLVLPGAGAGPTPALPGQQGHGRRREGGRLPSHPWPPGRLGGRPRGEAPAGRSRPRLRRALRRLHRDRGPLPRRPAHGPLGPDGR